ncbi:MAG: SGNH/GDSL hydrolase family protein [Oscillospiraceae bacterium]|jgi:lysophospholipase L1-like esterase|nr:SGNH/GDSL hydrolase family protein [Oscillospiraceae bacterium]
MDRREYQKYAARGNVNAGNRQKIRDCMKKALAGKPVKIGFLGGSVTQGSLASSPETCYAYLVYSWWKNKFPLSEVSYLNAGIGATTSQFGAARVKEDLLAEKPDFAVIDFSVNDEPTKFFEETYEGLIRTVLESKCSPAVLLLFNVRYDNGISAEKYHLRIGEAYHLPCVSMKSPLYQNVVSGQIRVHDISPDGLHPNDFGHRLIADTLIACLEGIYQDLGTKENLDSVLPQPLTPNRYQKSALLRNGSSEPVCSGFAKDLRPRQNISDCFKRGWTAFREGASILFEADGTGIAVQYRKSVKHPAPAAEAIIDGDEAHAVRLDANFDETWGDCLFITTVAQNLPKGKHRLEIRLVKSTQNPVTEFYLASVIESQ